MTPIHSTRLHLTYIGGDVKSMYHAIKEKGPLIGVGHPGESSAVMSRACTTRSRRKDLLLALDILASHRRTSFA
jgi:hypothetical protein